jgi:hypothetical protein
VVAVYLYLAILEALGKETVFLVWSQRSQRGTLADLIASPSTARRSLMKDVSVGKLGAARMRQFLYFDVAKIERIRCSRCSIRETTVFAILRNGSKEEN